MGSWLPKDQWFPAHPPILNGPESRSAANQELVICQFGVATHPRYQPIPPQPAVPATATAPAIPAKGWTTYCNIFVWDYTSAMQAAIPHYVNKVTRDPSVWGKDSDELDANEVYEWLRDHGSRFGWMKAIEAEARKAAILGKPVVSTWKNPTGRSGHIQAIKAPRRGDLVDATYAAQAGITCFEHALMAKGFDKIKPDFYVHA